MLYTIHNIHIRHRHTSVDVLGLAVAIVGDNVTAVGAILGAADDRLGIDVADVGDSVARVGRAVASVGAYTSLISSEKLHTTHRRSQLTTT